MRVLARRKRLGVRMSSEKSSANTEIGDDGRAVPAATSEGCTGRGSLFTFSRFRRPPRHLAPPRRLAPSPCRYRRPRQLQPHRHGNPSGCSCR